MSVNNLHSLREDFLKDVVRPILGLTAEELLQETSLPCDRKMSNLKTDFSRKNYKDVMTYSLLHETLSSIGQSRQEANVETTIRMTGKKDSMKRYDATVSFFCWVSMKELTNHAKKLNLPAKSILSPMTVGVVGDAVVYVRECVYHDRSQSFLIHLMMDNRHMELANSLLHQDSFNLTRLDFILTQFRRYVAIVDFCESFNAGRILHPSVNSLCRRRDISVLSNLPGTEGELANIMAPFNDSQKDAICSCLSMIHLENGPRMALIQGPPGTGKSSFIVGLLETLFLSGAMRTQGAALVCAPSNAAVDNLLIRMKNSPVAYGLNLVRMGLRERIANEAMPFSPRGEPCERINKLLNADIIFTTLNGAGSGLMSAIRDKCFNCLIVDEVGQAVEPDLLIPMAKFNVGKVVLVGDHLQLPPTVLSRAAIKMKFDRPFIQRFNDHIKNRQVRDDERGIMMLNVQYRMHPEICRFPNELVYDNRLETDRSVLARESFANGPLEPYLVYDLHNSYEMRNPLDGPNAGSVFNCLEMEFVIKLLLKLLSVTPHYSIGVITPYSAQLKLLSNMMDHIFLDGEGQEEDQAESVEIHAASPSATPSSSPSPSPTPPSPTPPSPTPPSSPSPSPTSPESNDEDDTIVDMFSDLKISEIVPLIPSESFTDPSPPRAPPASSPPVSRLRLSDVVDVRTVDSYQGGEKDVIVLSTVRAPQMDPSGAASTDASVGFVGSRHRLNVALTRAREALYVVGHRETLRTNSDWKRLYDDAAGRGRLVEIRGPWVDANAGVAMIEKCSL